MRIPHPNMYVDIAARLGELVKTEDEHFDYAPAPTPPQGRWRISGIGLSNGILRKVYRDNAAGQLGL